MIWVAEGVGAIFDGVGEGLIGDVGLGDGVAVIFGVAVGVGVGVGLVWVFGAGLGVTVVEGVGAAGGVGVGLGAVWTKAPKVLAIAEAYSPLAGLPNASPMPWSLKFSLTIFWRWVGLFIQAATKLSTS